jgi:hypothetical protein
LKAFRDLLLPKAWELACLRSGAQRQRNLYTRRINHIEL